MSGIDWPILSINPYDEYQQIPVSYTDPAYGQVLKVHTSWRMEACVPNDMPRRWKLFVQVCRLRLIHHFIWGLFSGLGQSCAVVYNLLDCCDAAKSDTYSNMWHVHGLSSVLRQPIHSIYPQANLSYRPFYNKLIQPREQVAQSIKQNVPLLIMWTKADVKWTPLNRH